MRIKILFILILALLWGIGSWRWYTCNIKGFCGKNSVNSSAPIVNTDTDGDGLPDQLENALGLSATLVDSDADGIIDFFEIGNDRKNPLDTDNDGIINALDTDDDNDGLETKTENSDLNGDGNPIDAADVDGDNILDFLDANHHDGPNADPDEDGLTNSEELKIGTDPNNTDSDGDGNPDGEEVGENHLQPSDANQNEIIDALEAAGVSAPISERLEVAVTTPSSARIYFPYNNSKELGLTEASARYFYKVATKTQEGQVVQLIGHTDNKGSVEYNIAMGLQRAKTIKQILINRGANGAFIKTLSRGESEPVASNNTDSGRKTNRRVELSINP